MRLGRNQHKKTPIVFWGETAPPPPPKCLRRKRTSSLRLPQKLVVAQEKRGVAMPSAHTWCKKTGFMTKRCAGTQHFPPLFYDLLTRRCVLSSHYTVLSTQRHQSLDSVHTLSVYRMACLWTVPTLIGWVRVRDLGFK